MNIDWIIQDKIGVLAGFNPVESPAILKQLEQDGFVQVVTVRPWPFTMAWRLPDCNLRNFMVRATDPAGFSLRDLFRVNEFCLYELAHGRRVPIWFEDDRLREFVVAALRRFFAPALADLDTFLTQAMATQRERFLQLPPEAPSPTGCRYCHEGLCHGDLVCHATTVESAAAIIQSGHILSACRARDISGDTMARDPYNASGDPPDYFEYIMWAAGNCTAVDKLVLERMIGRAPDWDEFEAAFRPGVRFFFHSDDLCRHPGFTHDGIHTKIHHELALDPWLVLAAIPEGLSGSDDLIDLAHRYLPASKAVSLPFAGRHYKDWASEVYCQARARSRQIAIE
jgi:hypothetical protein